MKDQHKKLGVSLIYAPFISVAIVTLVQQYFVYFTDRSWPFLWSVVLGLAWAPVLWTEGSRLKQTIIHIGFGFLIISGLALLATSLQMFDFATSDIHNRLGLLIATIVMLLMYILLALIQKSPEKLSLFQRWSYAGFYLDEFYTRLTLKIWPADWGLVKKNDSKQSM